MEDAGYVPNWWYDVHLRCCKCDKNFEYHESIFKSNRARSLLKKMKTQKLCYVCAHKH